MTISNQVVKRVYQADGTTRAWEVDYPVLADGSVAAFVTAANGTVTQVTEHFTWNAQNHIFTYPTVDSGLSPLAVGMSITLLRQTPLTQVTDLARQDVFDAETLEEGYDKLTCLAQELNEKISRAVQVPIGKTGETNAENFVTASALSTGLATKQDTLSSAQQTAVNSGITSALVTQIGTNQTNIANLQSGKLDASTASSTYLTQTNAAATYLTQTNAASTYLTQANAADAYLTKTDASSTYLTQTNAASTYATQTFLSTGLAGKQDSLTTAQLSAVNSGVTSQTVSQVTANASNLTAFAPFIQRAGLYGFSRQTVVDAADLLSATGTFNALNLDVSDNKKLTKLTAKGTSGSLANLSAVTVSKEAPFDNVTSPQIDISYSALNRSALVGLFNSLPYNVGYETVGSPTVSNGIISDPTGSDFAQTSVSVKNDDVTEMIFKFKLSSSGLNNDYNWIMYGGGSIQISVYGTSGGGFSSPTMYVSIGGTGTTLAWTNFVPVADTWYWLKYTNDGQTIRLYSSSDGETYTIKNSQNVSGTIGGDGKMKFGTRWQGDSGVFNGYIDLGGCSVKINNLPFFSGKSAMTKTCSVVGCTGTADLTSDDKAIATDKGWSLTVA